MSMSPSGGQALPSVGHCWLLMLQRSSSLCFVMLTCGAFLGKELALSVPQTSPLLILKSARFEFVLFSKRFCTRLCFVLSFVFTYGGTEDLSLRLPCGVTLNFLGFASLCKWTSTKGNHFLINFPYSIVTIILWNWGQNLQAYGCLLTDMSASDESLHYAECNFSLFPFITLLLLSSQKISFLWAKELRSMMNVWFSWMGQGNCEEINSGLSILQFINSGL